MSFRSLHYDEAIDNTLNFVTEAGVVCVASSGNDASNTLGYPAKNPNCIAVGNLNRHNERYSTSNYGSGLDILAPGNGTQANYPAELHDPDYHVFSGTSASAPMVSGVIGLLLSKYPNLTPDEVRQIIIGSAVDLTASDGYEDGYDIETGWGRLNAFNALNYDLDAVQRISVKNVEYSSNETIAGVLGFKPSSIDYTYIINSIYEIPIPVNVTDTYTLFEYSPQVEDQYHYLWNTDDDHYLRVNQAVISPILLEFGIKSRFKERFDLTIPSGILTDNIDLLDPFFAEKDDYGNWQQLGEYQNFTEIADCDNATGMCSYGVFINHNPEWEDNTPSYSIKASKNIVQGGQILEFVQWHFGNIVCENNDLTARETRVLFLTENNLSISAEYVPVNPIPNHIITIPEDEELLISHDAIENYTFRFAEGVQIVVNGSLKVIGSIENQINLTSFNAASSWNGIKLQGSGNVQISNSVISNSAECGLSLIDNVNDTNFGNPNLYLSSIDFLNNKIAVSISGSSGELINDEPDITINNCNFN
jgi:hypothetical protein